MSTNVMIILIICWCSKAVDAQPPNSAIYSLSHYGGKTRVTVDALSQANGTCYLI